MCVVSMIHDHYIDKWYPRVYPQYPPFSPFMPSGETEKERERELQEMLDKIKTEKITVIPVSQSLTKEEIDEFRKLLDRAREYDRKNNEPECPMDTKVALLKELARILGVDLGNIK